MNVLADCVTLYITRDDEDSRYACLDRSAAALKDELNLKHAPRYTLAEADVAPLTAVFDQLLTFLRAVKGLPLTKAPICHKFQVEVLFGMILHGDPLPTPERAALSFIRKVQKDIVSRSGKGRRETLEELYESIQVELEEEKVAKVEKKGPRPPKKTRLQLWTNYFGEGREGSCQVCSCVITAAKWEQAHIVPHSTGAVGTNAITNLVPTCMDCNRSCQTRDLREFAADTHPEAPFLKKLATSASTD
jgi:5-methylcytosine-specific restriction endonuclease McrA